MPKKELATGTIFADRYQVIEELGKGGMGKVYKVFDKDIEERVALKLLKPEIAADEGTIQRFRNELKLARKISHKNVCRMYDLGQTEGTRFITMEYVDGEDLKSFIKRSGQLTVSKAVFITKQVCEGLAEAHRLGVVHRDLKPQNIMIDREGNARIMDFGIARTLKTKGITDAGVILGTPEYMSPEQVEAKEVDRRSDIYSLGVILYEMVTGKAPFEGDTPLSVAMKHKTETPCDPKSLNPQISDELNRVILRCLSKEREKRYQNAEELLSELGKIEREIPTTEKVRVKKIKAGEETKKLKWRGISLYAAISLLLMMVVAAGVYFLTKRESPIDSIAVLPFDSKYADSEMEYIGDGLTETLISTLSKLPKLKVISRFSVFQYKGKRTDLQVVAKELNVKAILTGAIAQRGDNLSIITELIDVKDKTRLWGEQYNRKVGDIFVLQEEISKDISGKLRLRLSGEEKKALAKRYTDNTEAYRLYLQGRFYWNRRTPVDLQKAITYFEKAIAIDPNFSLGYASLAETYVVIGSLTFQPSEAAFPKAEEFCLKALSLDEELVEAHSALGSLKQWKWDYEGAEREYQRAIELNPNYATAHQWLAELYLVTGRNPLALKEIHIAQELDPHAIIMKNIEATIYLAEGRYDDAIKVVKGVVEENPDFDVGRVPLLHAYLRKRSYDEALKIAEELRMPGWKVILKGRIFAAGGQMNEARQMLEKYKAMSPDVYVDPCVVALLYGDLGELDEAFGLYQKALEERSAFLLNFNFYPPSDRVRQDPRFKDILKKIGLEK